MIQSVDISQAVNALGELARRVTKSKFNQAMARSINRSVSSGKTAASKAIRKSYKINKKDLDAKMGTKKASQTRLVGTISTHGVPIALGKFKPVQRKKGATVNITGRRQLIPHSFIATMPNGHRDVFMRGSYRPTGFEYKAGGRLPIRNLVTVSQGVMFSNPVVIEKTHQKIDEMFPARLTHEINVILAGIVK